MTQSKTHSNNGEKRKSTVGSVGDGGDKDPPKKSIEKSHAVSGSSKRKRDTVEKENQGVQECEINSEEMEVDTIVGVPDWAEQQLIESITIVEELACDEPIVFEEEYVTLHHVAFNQSSKKLQIEKVNLKNKKVAEKWNSEIDIVGVKPSKVLEFHQATGML
jgi:hypothetical protein